MSFDEKIQQVREKIAKTIITCSCGETIEFIDMDQHIRDCHMETE